MASLGSSKGTVLFAIVDLGSHVFLHLAQFYQFGGRGGGGEDLLNLHIVIETQSGYYKSDSFKGKYDSFLHKFL